MDANRRVELTVNINYKIDTHKLWLALYHLKSVKMWHKDNTNTIYFIGKQADMEYILLKLEEATVGLNGGLSMIITYLE